MCENEKMLLLLSGHLDGCNTPEEDALLEAHVAECPDCRQILNEYRKLDAGIAFLAGDAPDGFAARVMGTVEAEPPKTKNHRRFSFGVATAAAAAAAIFLLAVGSGMLPQFGAAGAKLNGAAVKSEAVTDSMAEAEPVPAEAPMAEEAAEAPEAAFSANAQLNRFPANVDCAALARTENRAVGLLYADPAEIPELEGVPYLPLDGGTRYEITQKLLAELAGRFGDLQIFEPEGYLPSEEDPACLIIAQAE